MPSTMPPFFIASVPSTLNYRELAPPIRRGLGRQRGRYGKRGVHKLRDGPCAICHASESTDSLFALRGGGLPP